MGLDMFGWAYALGAALVIAWLAFVFWPERPKTAEEVVDHIMQSLNRGRETRPEATANSSALDSKPRPGDPQCEWTAENGVLRAAVTIPDPAALQMLLDRLNRAGGWWVTRDANTLSIEAKCVPASH